MSTKKKVILDVDTGSDDAIAIMLAVLSGELDIIGITVTQGNRPLANCVENTLRVLDMLGVGDKIPVFAGCPQPMVRNLTVGRNAAVPDNGISKTVDGVEYSIHPAYLDLPAATSKVQQKNGVSFIIEAVKNSPDPVTLVPVGPPTNVGMAFRMDPTIIDNVEEVVFMGGGVDKGNITPVAEANFYHDPEAAKIIIDSGVKCRIIGLNATHSAELTLDDADKFIATGTPAGKLTGDLIRTRIEAEVVLGGGNGCSDAIHDALSVACIIDPTVITDLRRQKCDIDINGGASDGQLIVEHRNENDTSVNSYVAYSADKQKFFDMIYNAVASQK
ncbi:nucleoside hydrolase [Neobittarella massiliensis]|uniref:Nucleoside hydrolase n=2 Tax=Oscillospiraceae TaxID=216572 RepID=A0A8J6IQX1_9FIRM|nr:nucleoside hydrolase [Neobittarella massiliensis]SCJ91035.1 Pyrimidine-specific ribonucleoside hydrolase rihB [uncultured Anaerotruncus sp.]